MLIGLEGKTVGSFQVFNHLRHFLRKTNGSVLAIFLSYREKGDLSLAAVLRTLIQRLLDSEDALFETFLSHFHQLGDSTPLISELEHCIESLLRASSENTKYLIIDGLDEIEDEGERKNLVEHLLRLPSVGDIKVMLSGRPTSGISEFIAEQPEIKLHKYNSDTIRRFTSSVSLKLTRKFNLEVEESKVICERVADKSDGNYLISA